MSLSDLLGDPVVDETFRDERLSTSVCERQRLLPDPEPPRRPRMRGPLAIVGFSALLIGALVGWFVSAIGTGEEPPPLAPADSPQIPATVAAAAELFTTLWLTNGDVAALYAGEPSTSAGVWVNNAAIVAGEHLGDGTWSTTIAVDSLELEVDEYVPVDISYFAVAVLARDGRAEIVGGPTRVSMPRASRTPTTLANTVTTEQAATIESFLIEWLTGGAEARRYTSAVNAIDLFPDPPYESAIVSIKGADDAGRVVAVVTATTVRGATHSLEYSISLVFEDDVWAVADVGARTT